jgi:hypothetical protein
MTVAIERNPIYRGRRFQSEIIELCVRWYLTYRLSYRDLVEMLAERGVVVSHTTIYRWVQQYVPNSSVDGLAMPWLSTPHGESMRLRFRSVSPAGPAPMISASCAAARLSIIHHEIKPAFTAVKLHGARHLQLKPPERPRFAIARDLAGSLHFQK